MHLTIPLLELCSNFSHLTCAKFPHTIEKLMNKNGTNTQNTIKQIAQARYTEIGKTNNTLNIENDIDNPKLYRTR